MAEAGQTIPTEIQVSPDSETSEAWLHENPEVLASLLRGIEEAEQGETVSRGSFAKWAELRAITPHP